MTPSPPIWVRRHPMANGLCAVTRAPGARCSRPSMSPLQETSSAGLLAHVATVSAPISPHIASTCTLTTCWSTSCKTPRSSTISSMAEPGTRLFSAYSPLRRGPISCVWNALSIVCSARRLRCRLTSSIAPEHSACRMVRSSRVRSPGTPLRAARCRILSPLKLRTGLTVRPKPAHIALCVNRAHRPSNRSLSFRSPDTTHSMPQHSVVRAPVTLLTTRC